MTFEDTRREFAAAVSAPADAIDLTDAALIIAQTAYPELDRAAYVRQIDVMAVEAARRLGGETAPFAVANMLSEYLFDDEAHGGVGLRGNHDDYYDPRNSFLNDVLERKLGIPITLAVVYIEIGRRMGLPVEGAGMPGHFLVRYRDDDDGDVLIDPFHRGVILEPDDVAQIASAAGFDASAVPEIAPAVTPPEILARMLNNLKQIYLNRQEYARCLEMVELALCIEPRAANDLRLASELRRLV